MTGNDYESDEVYQLMRPLITAVSEWNTSGLQEVLKNWGQERAGILAWGVRSGYLLWARHNPGKIPTMAQAWGWFQKGGLL